MSHSIEQLSTTEALIEKIRELTDQLNAQELELRAAINERRQKPEQELRRDIH